MSTTLSRVTCYGAPGPTIRASLPFVAFFFDVVSHPFNAILTIDKVGVVNDFLLEGNCCFDPFDLEFGQSSFHAISRVAAVTMSLAIIES